MKPSFTLTRDLIDERGCFGVLAGQGGSWETAEHAYQDDAGYWAPKIPAGTYQCVRGVHALEDCALFTTYEILGVSGHSGLLFHKGNWPQRDSKGCVLLGMSRGVLAGALAVVTSAQAFSEFMAACQGSQEIQLTVIDGVAHVAT